MYITHKNHFYFYINLFFVFLSINIVITKLLNNIIELGGEDFTYIHFSFKSNGDMIVDIHSYPLSNIRRFYGLSKNGKFFF